ncbi:MAG: serine hydrolase [Bacteroidia bacterium]|nr:serine hydrolase [Bacteroidia bacterium]
MKTHPHSPYENKNATNDRLAGDGCIPRAAQDKDAAKKLKGLDEAVDKVMKDWKVQGLAVAVVSKDKVLYTKGYGMRDRDKKLPVTTETLFAIGSCSKAFTAASVCLLQQDDKLDLDKPVRLYLPSFKLHDSYATENMTPRDLLCHRSGLPRHDLMWYGSPLSREELFSRLQHLEFNEPFRAKWQYQNLMFMTAGYLVEEVSGTSWEDFTKQRLLNPLQMTSTNFSVKNLSSGNNAAKGYGEKNDAVVELPYRNIDAIGPAGSINSNITDMSHWAMMLVNGGKYNGNEILNPTTVADLQRPTMVTPAQVPLTNTESTYGAYGLGWFINTYRGHVLVQHGGNIDGFSASVSFLPYDSVGIVVLTNMNGTPAPNIVRNMIVDRMLGLNVIDLNKRVLDEVKKAREAQAKLKKDDDADRVKDTKPSHALAAYAGAYEHPAYGTIRVAVDNDGLVADLHGLIAKLGHYHYDIFEAKDSDLFEGAKLSFISNNSGEISELRMRIEPALKDATFTRKLEAMELESSALAKFVGEYDFGGQIAKVFVKGENTLTLFVPGQPEYELVAVGENEFKIKILEGFKVKFTLDGDGKVTSLASIQPNGTFTAKRK